MDADREHVERRVVNCFMQKQYWTMQQLRRTLGFSAVRAPPSGRRHPPRSWADTS